MAPKRQSTKEMGNGICNGNLLLFLHIELTCLEPQRGIHISLDVGRSPGAMKDANNVMKGYFIELLGI